MPSVTRPGGVILAFSNYSYVRAQWVDSSGSPQWGANGTLVYDASPFTPYSPEEPVIVGDGSGGAIIAWKVPMPETGYDIYAQRVNGGGVLQWANAVPVCTAPNAQQFQCIARDGYGGAVIGWTDWRMGTVSKYAQRIDDAGVAQWAADGVPLSVGCPSNGEAGIDDGRGGMFITWPCGGILAKHICPNGMLPWDSSGHMQKSTASSPTGYSDSSYFSIHYNVDGTSASALNTASVSLPGDVPEGHVLTISTNIVADSVIVVGGDTVYAPGDLISTNSYTFVNDTRPPVLVSQGLTYPDDLAHFSITTFDATTFTAFATLQYQVGNDSPYVMVALVPDSQFVDSAGTHWVKTVGVHVFQYRFILEDEVGNVDTTGYYDRYGHPEYSTASNTLPGGWNMVSVPLSAPDGRKSTLFPDAVSHAFAYNSGYVVQDTMNPGVGYWLKLSSAETVSIAGYLRSHDSVLVAPGWNMIGALSIPVTASDIALLNPGLLTSSFFGYSHGYQIADTLQPFQGYWIKVPHDGKLAMAASSLTAKQVVQQDLFTSFNRLTLQDAGGKSQTLYFSLGKGDAAEVGPWELPPPPPAGVFDVRFAEGRMAETIAKGQTGDFPVQVSSANYPLTIAWEMSNTAITASLKINGKVVSLRAQGTTRIAQRASSITLQLDGSPDLPKEFALEQNYPNPFNPTTVISYQLPVNSHVVLKVYNILGQVVKTLVDGLREAGYRSERLDASSLASGLYLYRLSAESVTGVKQQFWSVKKMLLLR